MAVKWNAPHHMLRSVTGDSMQCLVCFGYPDDPRHIGVDIVRSLEPAVDNPESLDAGGLIMLQLSRGTWL